MLTGPMSGRSGLGDFEFEFELGVWLAAAKPDGPDSASLCARVVNCRQFACARIRYI